MAVRPVVLVRVVGGVRVEDLGTRCGDGLVDGPDRVGSVRDVAVVIAGPEERGPDPARRLVLLAPTAHALDAPESAARHDEDRDLVAPCRMPEERRSTAELDVVGMRSDGQHLHVPTSQRVPARSAVFFGTGGSAPEGGTGRPEGLVRPAVGRRCRAVGCPRRGVGAGVGSGGAGHRQPRSAVAPRRRRSRRRAAR